MGEILRIYVLNIRKFWERYDALRAAVTRKHNRGVAIDEERLAKSGAMLNIVRECRRYAEMKYDDRFSAEDVRLCAESLARDIVGDLED